MAGTVEGDSPRVAIKWPNDGRLMVNDKFDAMQLVDGGAAWRLEFPFLLGRNWAPEQKQLAWAGDILLALSRAGFRGQVLLPPEFQH